MGNIRYVLHTATILHTNVALDARVARAAGYDGVELWFPKVARYLDAGYSVGELRKLLDGLPVTMLDVLLPIESQDPSTRRRLLSDCARMAEVAAALGCPAIQVVALDEFASASPDEQRGVVISSLRELAEIAAPYGVRLAIEPVVFSRFRSLAQGLEVIDAIGADRVGLCLDTWHLWTSGTPWEEVAALDRDLILSAHLSDTREPSGAEWRDEDRSALPGEGILPMRDAIDAILATGYEGAWSVEMISERHREWEPELLARAVLDRSRALMSAERGRS